MNAGTSDLDAVRAAVRGAIETIAPGVDMRNLRPDLPLRGQVDLDSMDWLNVLDALEARLSMTLPESELARLDTLDALLEHLAARRADAARASGASAPAPTPMPMPTAPTSATPATLPQPVRHVVGNIEVVVRPIGPQDLAREDAFIRRLSDEARYQRFMGAASAVPLSTLRTLTGIDQTRDLALAATVTRADGEEIVGVARYALDASGTGCEFAIVIADAWRRSGLAGVLMHLLVDVARRRGLATMEGIVLATNRAMLDLARRLGFEVRRDERDGDTVRVVLPLH